MNSRLLIVDDERAIVRSFRALFEREGFRVQTASDVHEARRLLRADPPDLVVADLQLAQGSGLDLLLDPMVRSRPLPLIVITSYPTVETAVEALRRGAADYLTKPLRFADLLSATRKALDSQGGKSRPKVDDGWRLGRSQELVGDSAPMSNLRALIARVAPTSSTVLITGESGTGKELVARQIHARSARQQGPFVAVNCSAIPETLLESELFGYRRGAFSGADRDKRGLVELAGGGTLLLDEIGDLPLDLQPKLLRALERREILPLGASRPRPIDVRFLAATHRSLETMVEEGHFRADLYYRLNLFELRVPPLRDRVEDIPALAEHFRCCFGPELGPGVLRVGSEALLALRHHPWKGNVRELENVMRRALVLCEAEEIRVEDLWEHSDESVRPIATTLKDAVREFEHRLICEAIECHHGDKRLAADHLGISLASLYAKLKLSPSSDSRSRECRA